MRVLPFIAIMLLLGSLVFAQLTIRDCQENKRELTAIIEQWEQVEAKNQEVIRRYQCVVDYQTKAIRLIAIGKQVPKMPDCINATLAPAVPETPDR